MIQDIAINAIGGVISGVVIMLLTTALSRKGEGQPQSKTNVTYGPSNKNIVNSVVNNNLIQIESTVTKQAASTRHQAVVTEKNAPPGSSSNDIIFIVGLSLAIAIYFFATHEDVIFAWLQGAYIFIAAFICGCALYVLMARKWSFSRAVIIQTSAAILAQVALWTAVEMQQRSPWGSLGRAATQAIRKNGVLQAVLENPSTFIIASLQLFGLALSVFSALCAMQFALLLLAQSRIAGRINNGKTYNVSAWIINKLGSLKQASISCFIIAVISLLLSTGVAYRGGEWLNNKIGDALVKLEASANTDQSNTTICLEISGILADSTESVYQLEQQNGRRWEPTGATLHVHPGDKTPQKECVTFRNQKNAVYRWVDPISQEKSNSVSIK